MKRARFALVTTLALVTAGISQVTGWDQVKALRAGTEIKVQLIRGRTFGHCRFDSATEDHLTCSISGGHWWRLETFPRSNIKAVFRTHDGMLIGVGAGAATGAALGASRATCCRGANAFLGTIVGGAIGGLIGSAADPFFHGTAVYRGPGGATVRPGPGRTPAPDPKTVKTSATQPKIPCLRDGATRQCVDQGSPAEEH